MNYLAELNLIVTGRSTRSKSARGQIQAYSAGELLGDLDVWLRANDCPSLSHWTFGAQSGSNAPASRGVLNTVHYDLIQRGDNKSRGSEVVKSLLITTYALRPIDPIQERIL
jgi:hypothetical protein